VRRRDLLAVLPALAACGETMNLDNGVQARRPPQLPSVYDFRSLSSASKLYMGYTADYGLTAAGTMLAQSASHPAVMLTGNLRQWPALGLRFDPIDGTTMNWSVQNGWGWTMDWLGQGGTGTIAGLGGRDIAIPKGSTLDLGIGIIAHFAAEDVANGIVYSSACNYRATCGKLESFGYHAGCDLDNTSVYASRGMLIERYSCNNRAPALVRRNEAGLSPGALGNRDQCAGLVAGNNKPFELWILDQCNSSNISTQPVARGCFSNSGNTTYDWVDFIYYGPDEENFGRQQRHLFRRRSQGAAIVSATKELPIDNSWAPKRLKFDGTNLQVWQSGIPLFVDGIGNEAPVPWTSGALTCDQFLLNAIQLGNNPPTNHAYAGYYALLGFDSTLTNSQADELWTALS
jgi:hypothetical protein